MSIKHLSDNEIQLYLDNKKNDNSITEHIYACESCRTLLSNYELLYSSIECEEISLSDNFSLNTMSLIHGLEAESSYSSRNIILIGVSGILLSLLSMVYIVGYEVILQYIKDISFVEMFTYKQSAEAELNRYGSIIKIGLSGGIILLFYTQLDKILSRLKTNRISIF